jgi:DNA recombination protein RmuC
MDVTLILLTTLTSAVVTGAIVWFIAARRLKAEQTDLAAQRERAVRAEAALEAAQTAHADKLATLQDAQQQLRDTFASLSSAALKDNNEQFLQLAQERLGSHQQTAKNDLSALVNPLREALDRQEKQTLDIERIREQSYGSLTTLLDGLRQDQLNLRSQTDILSQSLRNPRVRGRWGEIQLRRLIELAGMLNHCDFEEQQSATDADQKRQRPDLIVQLPNGRQIIVDAKVPLDRFIDAMEAAEEQRADLFRNHAKAVRGHIDEMVRRAYHKQFDRAHEFTVIFIPGEVFYQTALEYDHELLEYGLGKNIIIASPNTLIAVLKSAALGWREVALSKEARTIQEEGRKLYESLSTLAEHLNKIGKGLSDAAKSYNSAIGSIEERMLPRARKLHELKLGAEEPTDLRTIESDLRVFSKPELVAASERSAAPIAPEMPA